MKPSFLPATAALLGVVLLSPSAFGDTVVLTNGNSIEGTVVSDERSTGGKLTLDVAGGTMFFRASEVAQLETGPAAAPAEPTGNFVEVRLAKGNTFYGSGSYFGRVHPDSNDEHLVLAIPDAGTITIPRSAVASIEEIEGSGPVTAIDSGADEGEKPAEISTTHAIYMKNGRKLLGSLLPTGDEEPVKVKIGHLGVLTIARKDIDRIAEEAGTITLPPPPEETTVETETTETPPEPELSPLPGDLDALKAQIKEELLRELLQELLGVRVGVLLDDETTPAAPLVTTETTLEGEVEIPIRDVLYDLTRERTTFRVRAENRLKALGPVVLPYIRQLVYHPFDLTRRAVQRIAQHVDTLGSVPIAVEALNDPDAFVRETAHETLEKMLPEVGIAYDPGAPEATRLAAQADYWVVWDQLRIDEARRRLLDRLTNGDSREVVRQPNTIRTGWRAAPTMPIGDWHGPPSSAPGAWRPAPLLTPNASRD